MNSDPVLAPLPPEACDSHMHFYDDEYESASTTVLKPPNATVDQYRELQQQLGCRRVVVVQPTTYGMDNSCQLDAADKLRAINAETSAKAGSSESVAADCVRLVAVVDSNCSTDELQELHRRGVRGARFHMLAGGAVGWEHIEPVATTIAEFGWHIQLQLNGRELADRESQLASLATPLVIDHVGRFMPPVEPDHESFAALRRLLQNGKTWVKISAPYESSVTGPPDYNDTTYLARQLVSEFPQRLLWATNWPHPGQANPPTVDDLGRLLDDWIPAEYRQQILVDNPAQLYGFQPSV